MTQVLTVGDGVYGFTLDPMVGEFILSHDNIKVPAKGKIYSFNEGNYASWSPKLKEYMQSLKAGGKEGGKAYSARCALTLYSRRQCAYSQWVCRADGSCALSLVANACPQCQPSVG